MESEKQLLEKIKNIQMNKLFNKGTYVDILTNNVWKQGIIKDIKPNNKYDIIYLFKESQFKKKPDTPIASISIIGENTSLSDNLIRTKCLNNDIFQLENKEALELLTESIQSLNIDLNSNEIIEAKKEQNDEKEKNIYKAYNLSQFLCGTFVDFLAFIYYEIDSDKPNNKYLSKLISLSLDIVIFILEQIKKNTEKIRFFINNKKSLLFENIYAIFSSFQLIISNIKFIFSDDFISNNTIYEKKIKIINECYQLILNNSKNYNIPIQILAELIIFITANNTTKKCIDKFQQPLVFQIYTKTIENFTQSDIKNLKKLSKIKEYSTDIIKGLFSENKENNTKLINNCYYLAILIFLKSNFLEKKIMALNSINEIILDEKYNEQFYQYFIVENKILDIFFDESAHDEVIKRSNNLLKYLAMHDKLDDNVIQKLLKLKDDNEFFKNIIIDILTIFPSYRKEKLFKSIVDKFNFDAHENDIEYLLKLVEACLIPVKQNENKNNEKNDKETNEKEKIEEYEKSYQIGLKGLDLLFNYIIKDFDTNKTIEENNVNKAIDIFDKVKNLKNEDIYNYIEKLFENIRFDNEHKSVIQSIILIQKLLNNLTNYKNNIFEKLDEKYKIFNLIINDLIRYINILKEKNINPEPNDIYEGIYPYEENIEQRFQILFFFEKGNKSNKGLNLNSKEHLEKIYSILNNPIFHNDLINFFSIFSRNINYIPNETLEEFLNNIIETKKNFDLSSFTDKSIFLWIKNVISKLNTSESILVVDVKNILVKKINIKKLDLLFNILIQNNNEYIQNQVCKILKDTCLNLYDYKTSFSQKYWSNFINKIETLFLQVEKENNLIGLSGLIKLIDIIYSSCINCGGKIPQKSDIQSTAEPYEIYHFCYPAKKNKEYKLRVGNEDKLVLMRWKLGYYYDINVNNLVFESKDKKRYSFIDDQSIFQEIFPKDAYCLKNGKYILINVYEEKDILLKMKGNPKELIEKNKNIYNILIKNLHSNAKIEEKIKQRIWNILFKSEKDINFDKIKKYGEKEIIKEKKLKKIFNIENIYIFTLYLESIKEYLEKNKENDIKEEYLKNLIKVHHLDNLFFNILMNFDTEQKNCKLIHYEFLIALVDVIKIIENHKNEENNDKIYGMEIDSIFKKISKIILDLSKIEYKLLYDDNHFNEYDIVDEENNDDKYEYITNKIDKMISYLLENIIKLIKKLSGDNENAFIEYLFNNQDLFMNIFFYDYVRCEKKDIKNKLNEYLSKHLFNTEDEKYIQKYFNTMLSIQIFNELLINDNNGAFFKELSKLMKKYEKKYIKENEIEKSYLEQFKKIIDIILNYIEKECETSGFIKIFETAEEINNKKEINSNSSKIEGILTFLKCILKLSPKKLVTHLLNKIDICELFLNKCIIRKCNPSPLNTPKMLCDSDKSKETMFDLIIFILRNLPEEKKYLVEKIWNILDSKNKLGFWKKKKMSKWKMEPEDIPSRKYVGLKNMTATCYMNSIIQQFFMIPLLRETILSIQNVNPDTVLYHLQLLFSALKSYERKFYNPRPFVVKSGLIFDEQMDADEYYGQLIDKIENDIKEIYSVENKENPYKDLFKFFFGIKVIDELYFVDCGHKRFNEFYYNSIQLEIKGFDNIEDSLKNYCKTEILDGDNKINCEICNIKRTCHKRQIFKLLPNILVIALKRFEFDYDSMIKIKLNSYFKFPFELNMKDYLIENNTEKNTLYELTGITIHDGEADFGHYYDLIKAPDNLWYKFNDKTVKKFNEDDIPKEAYGERNLEDKVEEEEEEENNNAYILIYTRKDFNNENVSKYENCFKTKLAVPPFSKMSNINDEYKKIINLQMYEFWTLENIKHPLYQEFVYNLFKIDLAKNINKDMNLEKDHPQIYKELKEEELINESINNNANNKTFEYALRYYFNIMLRMVKTERKYMDKYTEIIKINLENNLEKCKFILEEFSDNDAINEYLVFCPIEENIKYTSNIILLAFKRLYEDKKLKDKNILFLFINSFLTFINYNIDVICLEYVINLFNQLIHLNKDKKIIKYLKEKNIGLWIISLDKEKLTEEDEANNDLIMSFDNLPPLKSTHFILTEKENIDNTNTTDEDTGLNKAQEKKLKNIDINFNLIRKIGYELNKED